MKIKDFFDLYFSFVENNTEAAFIFHRWSIISSMAALLGRRTSVHMGHWELYPNFYVQLLGHPGTRKSSAISIAKNLIREVGYDSIAANRTTKEKFLADLANQNNLATEEDEIAETIFDTNLDFSQDAEIFIIADEFNNFLGNTPEEFLSLLAELWDMKGEYNSEVRQGKSSRIVRPTINLLSGNVPSGFRSRFGGDLLTQGILTRIIVVPHNTLRTQIPFPPKPDAKIKAELLKVLGPMTMFNKEIEPTDEAREFLAEIYTNWEIDKPIYMEAYANRRFVHLLKLCLVFAALEQGPITKDIALYANTCLAVVEKKMEETMQEIFDSAHDQQLRAHMYDIIKDNSDKAEPTSIVDIVSQLSTISGGTANLNKVSDLISTMLAQNLIIKTDAGGLLVKKKLTAKGNFRYIDVNLVTEEEREVLA